MSNPKILRSNSVIQDEAVNGKMQKAFTSSQNAAETYDRAGLWLLVKSLTYFGFKLLERPKNHCCLNRPYVAFLLAFTFIAFAFNCYIRYALAINNDGSLDLESASFNILMTGGFLTAIFIYLFGVLNARNYNILFKSLASAVDQVNDSERRQKFARSVNRTFFLWSVPCFLITIFVAVYSFPQEENWLDDQGMVTPFLFIFSSTLNCVWFATIGQFYFFTSIYLFIACKMIDFLLEIYLGPEVSAGEGAVDDIWNNPKQWDKVRADKMSQKLINHRKISQIVEQANSVFSYYLFFTLTIETSICIAFVKLITMKKGAYSIMAYAFIFHIAMMLWKAFKCGNVNEKLKTYLTLKKLPNFYQYSNVPEQVSYVLYLEEQNINRAVITYGNLFPIGKTFIFTIIGTVITYAMVLQGM